MHGGDNNIILCMSATAAFLSPGGAKAQWSERRSREKGVRANRKPEEDCAHPHADTSLAGPGRNGSTELLARKSPRGSSSFSVVIKNPDHVEV